MSGDGAVRDVVVVGGGPAGTATGVFCAREGLDTLVFDRGRSSLKRCAFLENYPGFPAGIDIETLYDLFHEQLTEAGCELVPDLVASVERTETGFRVETDEGRTVATERVVAAAKYDADYLRPLGTSDAMFETHDHDGETVETFDRDYPADDGSTPIEGLYVAGPLAGVPDQAIVAAGHGATVGRRLIADTRREDGYWDAVADRTDWVRRDAELDAEWQDRDRWHEWFESQIPADLDRDAEPIERVRTEVVEATLDTYIDAEEIERRRERGHRHLAAQLDEEAVLAGQDDAARLAALDSDDDAVAAALVDSVDSAAVLDALDDEAIRAYLGDGIGDETDADEVTTGDD